MTQSCALPDFERWHPTSPYIRRLAEFGPVYCRKHDEALALRVTEDHTNMHAMAHGGLLATLVDCALGHALVTRLGIAVVTVQMSVSYLKAVREGAWLEAHTSIDKQGRKLVYATCNLTVDGNDVVKATSVFTVRSQNATQP